MLNYITLSNIDKNEIFNEINHKNKLIDTILFSINESNVLCYFQSQILVECFVVSNP